MRQRRHGFTLVELLVVIGIIALLISILMPALNTARAQARLVQCQSNFKQIYNAVAMYANGNQGFLPFAATDNGGDTTIGKGTWGASGTNASIYFELAQQMGYSGVDNDIWESQVPAIFRCTEFNAEDATVGWNPWVLRTVRFHPRAFPGTDQYVSNANKGGQPMPGEWPQRKLSSIKDSASKIAFWDTSVSINWNYTPVPSSIQLDGWHWSWGHQYCDPSKIDWDQNNLKNNLNPGWGNREETGYFSSDGNVIRFRHLKETTTVVAFFDGHVESRNLTDQRDATTGNKLADIKVGEICINHHRQ